jgi:hypothetical protein
MSENNKFYFSLLFYIVLSLTVLAAPAAAQVSAQPTAAGSYGMTSGRLVASTSAVLALIGVVIGVLALVRPSGRFGTASGRAGAIVSLAGGLIGTVIGGWVAATAGGIGTGGGFAGAIVALVLGLIAISLGGLALSRSRRIG